jgi:hypothetical protein
MNYTELTQLIQDFCETDEATFVSQIPQFIKNAEERIVRTVRIPELRKAQSGSTSSGNRYLQRPDDFLTAFSMAVIDGSGDYTYLMRKDVNFIREAYPNPTTQGMPLYYAQFEGDRPSAATEGYFLLGPTPDNTYTIEIYYYYDPPSIVDNGTSWLGDNAENPLLYGSLVEAYTFLKGDPDMMQQYKTQYMEGLAQLGTIDAGSMRDDYRNGPLERR